MRLHRGRLIDHVHLRTRRLEESKAFYIAALGALGLQVIDGGGHFFIDELWVDEGESESRVHLAFQAEDREQVQRFYEAALTAGGRDNGAPGERDYHPGYYACFVLDPDGNNIEAVYHGPHDRSAPSVVIDASG